MQETMGSEQVSEDNEESDEKVTILKAEDIEPFFEALENPPPPTEKMKEAFRRHKKFVKQ